MLDLQGPHLPNVKVHGIGTPVLVAVRGGIQVVPHGCGKEGLQSGGEDPVEEGGLVLLRVLPAAPVLLHQAVPQEAEGVGCPPGQGCGQGG